MSTYEVSRRRSSRLLVASGAEGEDPSDLSLLSKLAIGGVVLVQQAQCRGAITCGKCGLHSAQQRELSGQARGRRSRCAASTDAGHRLVVGDGVAHS